MKVEAALLELPSVVDRLINLWYPEDTEHVPEQKFDHLCVFFEYRESPLVISWAILITDRQLKGLVEEPGNSSYNFLPCNCIFGILVQWTIF